MSRLLKISLVKLALCLMPVAALTVVVLPAAGAEVKKSRDQLLREQAALQSEIRFYEMQIPKLEKDARELDRLATRARRDNMLTSAIMFSSQAREFRSLKLDYAKKKGAARVKLARINALLR
jgi:hypothetical protein